MKFHTEGPRLVFEDGPDTTFLNVSAALLNIVNKQEHNNITLDFSETTYLEPKIIVPLLTVARSYRIDHVFFDIITPKVKKLSDLFHNANWSNLISPEKFEPRDDLNDKHLSALQYRSSDEQYRAVDRCLMTIIKTIPGVNRKAIRALEWSLSEITDNVLNHAESHIGGVLQVMSFPKKKLIEIYVCDAGIGIPRSLRSGRPELTDHVQALRESIQEGVTRNKQTNQGNGLFGAYRCSSLSGGEFEIYSGNAFLKHSNKLLSVTKTGIPARGTFIRACINYGIERLLEEAFVFRNVKYDFPNDFIDKTYRRDSDDIHFIMIGESNSFRSREAGMLVRNKIQNITEEYTNKLTFDFAGIHVISSSFADEVFAKIYVQIGRDSFNKIFKFINTEETVKILIDRSIRQRLSDRGR
ncbi:STAS-like domain-containing protein [Methylorubrum populi]